MDRADLALFSSGRHSFGSLFCPPANTTNLGPSPQAQMGVKLLALPPRYKEARWHQHASSKHRHRPHGLTPGLPLCSSPKREMLSTAVSPSCCQGWRANTDPARGIRREKAFFKIKCSRKVETSSCQEPSRYPGGGTWEPATTSFSTPSRGDLDQLVARLPREGGAASSPGHLCCHLSWAVPVSQVFLLEKILHGTFSLAPLLLGLVPISQPPVMPQSLPSPSAGSWCWPRSDKKPSGVTHPSLST